MKISDSIEIEVAPKVVFDWLSQLDDHYREWHPDHRACYWLKGNGLSPGAVLYAEEILHGKLHRLRYLMREVDPGHRVAFKILGAVGLLIPSGEFRVEPTARGSRFSATLYPRFGHLLKVLIPGRAQALITHQHEEGKNLKRLLERIAS